MRIDLARPLLGVEEEDAVLNVLRSGQLGPGPRVREFESAFAAAHEARHGVACSNGTVAIEHALRALGVGAGDDVIVPAFTFIATANAVLSVGARPVFVDIDPASFVLDPSAIQRVITPGTKAVIPVHLYGNAADLTAIRAAVGEGVVILEDAAQAHLARHAGRKVGSIGDAATFSFYPTKNMTTGEGGVVLTQRDDVAARLRAAINHGRAPGTTLGTYDHVEWGTNARLSDIHAAIGLAQLRKLEAWTERRRENAARLRKGLADVVAVPRESDGDVHVYHQFTIRVPRRDEVAAKLREAGVGCGVYYPKVLYDYPHLRAFARTCPEAERAVREVLSIPVHAALGDAEIDHVVREVRRVVSEVSR